MATVFLPDGFPTREKLPDVDEHQRNKRVDVDRDTGAERYLRNWNAGIVWWFTKFTKPGARVLVGCICDNLDATLENARPRLDKLVDAKELTREQVTTGAGQQTQRYTLTDLGRQRQAEYNAANSEDDD
jgi:hypothetical protein